MILQKLLKDQPFIRVDEDGSPGSMVFTKFAVYDRNLKSFEVIERFGEIENSDEAVLYLESDSFDGRVRFKIFVAGLKVHDDQYVYTGQDQDSREEQERVQQEAFSLFNVLMDRLNW